MSVSERTVMSASDVGKVFGEKIVVDSSMYWKPVGCTQKRRHTVYFSLTEDFLGCVVWDCQFFLNLISPGRGREEGGVSRELQ